MHKILIWNLGRCIGLAGLLSMAAMLSACGDIHDDDEPGAKKNHAATVFPVAAPAWQACETVFPGDAGLADPPEGRYECAVVKVPLDYAEPAGKMLDLALRRRAADDIRRRIGTLFIEPGGPGGSGVDAVPHFASSLSREVLQRFDIVGFDPRGVGRTRPSGLSAGAPALQCGGGLGEYFSQDLADTRPGASAVLASAAAAYAQTCLTDPVMPHMGTMNVVRDLEVLRRAVGDAGLTYLGVSYGTEVGILYADIYPAHVRAMIIDGVVNPAHSGADILVTQAIGWQKGLEAFFAWCKTNVDQCPVSADPESGFRQMQALSRSEPATLNYKGKPITLSSGWVTLLSVLSIYDTTTYPQLAEIIHAVLQPTPDWRLLQARASALASSDSLGPSVWTSCMDQPLPRGDAYEALVSRAAAAAPLTGAVQANINRPCAYLPMDPDPVRRDYSAQGSAAIMVWGSTGDPATPYRNSQEAAAQLSNASLFTFVADQHVAMGGGPQRKACVVDVQSEYLLGATLQPQVAPCVAD